jgi:hypothetical protein
LAFSKPLIVLEKGIPPEPVWHEIAAEILPGLYNFRVRAKRLLAENAFSFQFNRHQ